MKDKPQNPNKVEDHQTLENPNPSTIEKDDRNANVKGGTPIEKADHSHDATIENLPPAIRELLDKAGLDFNEPSTRDFFLEFTQSRSTKFSGPLQFPPAEILEGWERVYPGTTAKLVEWSERQTRHRHRLELERARRSERRADRGQWIAAIIAIGSIIAATIVALDDASIAAVFIAMFGVGGPAAATALAHRWKPPKTPMS